MSSLRRGLLVTAVAAGLTLAATPARAGFDDTASMKPPTVRTLTVQPPTGLSTAGSVCTPDGLELHLSWQKSSTPRTASHRVEAYTFFGFVHVPIATTGANTTRIVTDLPDNDLGWSFTVTTVTDYGWTAESAQTGTLRC